MANLTLTSDNNPSGLSFWDANANEISMATQPDLDVIREKQDAFEEKMEDRLSKIEDQIVLVRRDVVLEEDYKELKEAWEAYNKLAEKLRTFKRLKDSA